MGDLVKVFIISLGINLFLLPIGEIQAKVCRESTIVNEKSTKWSAGIITPSLNNFILVNPVGIPANELYEGSWNTELLKAYESIVVPDTSIDVSSFVMPVEGRVISDYGFHGKYFHCGTDIKLQIGDTVRAAFEGKVRIRKYDRIYGYYLALRHPNGLETVYGHLSQFLVEQDQNVKAGQPIGLGGNTGWASGPHLHFEFRFLSRTINPTEIIDFDEFALKDDVYVYRKSKSRANYIDNQKYTSKEVIEKPIANVETQEVSEGGNNGRYKHKWSYGSNQPVDYIYINIPEGNYKAYVLLDKPDQKDVDHSGMVNVELWVDGYLLKGWVEQDLYDKGYYNYLKPNNGERFHTYTNDESSSDIISKLKRRSE